MNKKNDATVDPFDEVNNMQPWALLKRSIQNHIDLTKDTIDYFSIVQTFPAERLD